MTKRCCAKNCYNSQLASSGTNIQYFGLPKGELANEWAARAGRQDLVDRPYKILGKYYLCSEHFTNDCFYDTNRLMLKRREGVVPTIFKNNLDKFVPPSVKEVHAEIKLTPQNKDQSQELEVKIKSWVSGDSNGQENSPSIHEELTEECLPLSDLDEFIELNETNRQVVDNLGDLCRLCALNFPHDIAVPIFDMPDSAVERTLEQLLPNQIKKDDGKPQAVCLSCWDKAQTCLSTLQMFATAQILLDNS